MLEQYSAFRGDVSPCQQGFQTYNPPLPEARRAWGLGEQIVAKPVAIIMGSQSDWATMKHTSDTLDALKIGYEALIVSAHRTPKRLYEFAHGARDKGFKVVIAGAGGAAHLPGMAASMTPLPVLGVPINTHALEGKDSLLSILQMPGGIPVGTLAIGKAGAINAALLAAAILALSDKAVAKRLDAWRAAQTKSVAKKPKG
jgi:5-(carboxyamino)imidazole ribonucleotide mutase